MKRFHPYWVKTSMVFLFLGIFCLVPLVIQTEIYQETEQQKITQFVSVPLAIDDGRLSAIRTAQLFEPSVANYHLRLIRLKEDYITSEPIWHLIWSKPDGSSIVVNVEQDSKQVVYFSSIPKQINKISIASLVRSSEAVNLARKFLIKQSSQGTVKLNPFIMNEPLVELDQGIITITWYHMINHVLVRGDRVTEKIDSLTNTICNYIQIWHDYSNPPNPKIGKTQAIQYAFYYLTQYVKELADQCELTQIWLELIKPNYYWAAPPYEPLITSKPSIAWATTFSRNGEPFAKFDICAQTGRLIGGDSVLAEAKAFCVTYGNPIAMVNSTEMAYDHMRSIGYTSWFYQDASKTTELNALTGLEVWFHGSHGGVDQEENPNYNYVIAKDNNKIMPSDIPGSLPSMKFAYIQACYSAKDTPTETLWEALSDAGCDAFFGYYNEILCYKSQDFCSCFWDAIYDGMDLGDAFTTADDYIPYTNARLYGDDSMVLFISETDNGGDTRGSAPLTSLYEGMSEYIVTDEPIFGSDIDYYKLSGSVESFRIQVSPLRDWLDVKIILMDKDGNILETKDSCPHGISETLQYDYSSGEAPYYVQVVIVAWDGYGGHKKDVYYGATYNLLIEAS